MQLQSSMTRRKRLSLTSLIDVIFLLLLFFMLSSTFSKFSKVEIDTAQSGSSGSAQSTFMLISLGADQLRLNGRPVEYPNISDVVKSAMTDEKASAIITTSKGSTTQQLIDLLDALSNVEGLAITVAR